MNSAQPDNISGLSSLFEGYEKAHGRYDVKRENEKGKKEGRAVTYKEPVSQRAWDEHLSGTGPGVGIIPLRADNTVLWACIDIDVIGIDHKALEAKCHQFGLPLVICRSKSGGAHCFLFLSEPIDFAVIVSTLGHWAAALGHGGCEIFPKQTVRHDDQKDIGNWLNMPYYYLDATLRYCVHAGEQLDLPAFLAFANSMRVSADKLRSIAIVVPDDENSLFPDGPPCLQFIAANGGFPDGTRNDGMYNAAVYLKKRYPDDLNISRLNDFNAQMCHPPLPADEISAMSKSVAKKDYEYRCRRAPINAHCNRSVCVARAYGIGDNLPPISLTKYDGEPVLWFFEINGKRIMLETRELMTQQLFQEKVGQAINDYPRTLKQPDWEQRIGEAMRNCDVVEVEIDDTALGAFRQAVLQYVTGQARTVSKAQLLTSNAPFAASDGTIWFRLRGLIRHLENQNIKFKSEHHVTQMLKDMGCEASSERVIPGKGGIVRVWKISMDVVPTDLSTEPPVKFGTTEF